MTNAEVKQQLGEYLIKCGECGRLRKRIDEKREDMEYLRSILTNSASRGSGWFNSAVERVIEQIDELIKYYVKMIAERETSELQVIKMIESIDNPDSRSILFMKYIEGKTYEDIESELNISEATRKRRYNEAIEKLTFFEPL